MEACNMEALGHVSKQPIMMSKLHCTCSSILAAPSACMYSQFYLRRKRHACT